MPPPPTQPGGSSYQPPPPSQPGSSSWQLQTSYQQPHYGWDPSQYHASSSFQPPPPSQPGSSSWQPHAPYQQPHAPYPQPHAPQQQFTWDPSQLQWSQQLDAPYMPGMHVDDYTADVQDPYLYETPPPPRTQDTQTQDELPLYGRGLRQHVPVDPLSYSARPRRRRK